ncbi:MAG TPA: DNA polymerase domain-containing protein, partial [Candidatus Thermoplasmatota archaeon]|nr:DNA polymerase domain-containing protein [Candidatus Thermoplasmatota archaeon]
GMWGLVDMSRLSGIPLGDLARLEAGTAVTSIQIREARRQGRLVPWKKNTPETPKTLRRLVQADRGGFIFDPKAGLFEDVVELDFSSMYPSLIDLHNLGSETILCACCDPATLPPERFVPQAGYHVCAKRRGLVPDVLRRLVKRRADLKLKRKAETDPSERKRWQGPIDGLKWLNVVAFGYQGYRNARFGSIEAHEATCAWDREALLTASEVARDAGYEVVHGIVDNLYLRRVRAAASVEALAAQVERAVGVRFEPQGRYKWIVFLPTRAHDAPGVPRVGAPNRFYGCFDKVPDAPSRSQMGQDADTLAGGALKVRGVEYRQSSAPGVVCEAQKLALETLALAGDKASFLDAVPRALDAARPVVRRIRDGACATGELEIVLRVARGLDGRRQMNHGHAALRQLARRGVETPPGDKVRFVVTDAASRDPDLRVRETSLFPDGPYDAAAYEALVVRALASLLLPVGYDEARVAERFAEGPRQARLPCA